VETLLKSGEDTVARVRSLMEERRALQNELQSLRRQVAMGGRAAEGPHARDVNGMKFVAQVMTGVTGKDLPPLIDEMKAGLGSGAVLLVADTGGKVAVAAGVTDDLTDRVSAVDLLRAAVAEMGGKGGGGRPDMAQGGAQDVTRAEAGFAAAAKVLEGS
jgi:alanyl-tRNA synthetase